MGATILGTVQVLPSWLPMGATILSEHMGIAVLGAVRALPFWTHTQKEKEKKNSLLEFLLLF